MKVKQEILISTVDGEMKIQVCDITAYDAQELLKLNTCNRGLKKSKLRQYTKDMILGNWKINGEPIIIGDDNILKNGQHRLTALIQSGVILRDQIIITLPSTQANCYDIGAARTIADLAVLGKDPNKNMRNSSIVSGITTRLKARDLFSSKARDYTKLEIIDEIKKCDDACDFVREHYINATRLPGLRKSGVIASLINCYQNGYPEDKLKRFCEVLASGLCIEEKEIGIIKLRNWLLENCGVGRNPDWVRETYYRTQNILKAYEKNKTINSCRQALTEHYGYC